MRLFWALWAVAVTAHAGSWYPSVAVIRNSRSANSIAIADYFVSARADTTEDGRVLRPTVISVDCDSTEEIGPAEFDKLRGQVEAGVLAIEAAEPWRGGIEYLVTTKGVPLKVNRGAHYAPRDPSASVNDELALILGPYEREIGWDGPTLNPFFTPMSTHWWKEWRPYSRKESGVFVVTRLDALTLPDVLALVDRSHRNVIVRYGANIVFDQDPTKGLGGGCNYRLDMAADTLREYAGNRYNVVSDTTTTYLTRQSAVLGYFSWGSNDESWGLSTDFARPHNEWVPGAISETFVSTSARSFELSSPAEDAGQSLVSDLVGEGCSGAKGYVYEPFASGVSHTPTLVFSYFVQGEPLGVAFLRSSLYLGWMGCVIGDPLASVKLEADGSPVELASFTARAVEHAVSLEWVTFSETNNLGFAVERQQDESGWREVAFIRGAGTSSKPNRYQIIDTPGCGIYLYRLRQVDTDGTISYSQIVQVTLQLPDRFLAQNYPNPFNPSTCIVYCVACNTHVKLAVYDVLGKEVAILADGKKSEGTYTTTFDGTHLPSGIYFARLETDDGFVATRRMLLLK